MAEYEVLVRHTVDLQLAVQDNLTSLGAQLVAAQIITPDQYREIRNPHRPVNERGADLVGYVQNKVRQDPRHYHAFIDALRSDLSQCGDILKKLGETTLPLPVIPQPSSPRDGPQLPPQDNLKIADLMDAKSALWDARAKWRNIGSCIGVDEGTLDTMKGKDPGESLREVLSHWLRGVYDPKEKNSKPRTWHTLVEALRDKTVNEEAMANKLETDRRSNPPDVPPATHNLTFSSSMSDEDFSKWLRSKGISDKDCKTLSDNGITPSGFLQCDVEDFDDIGLTKIGKKLVLKNFTEVKGQHRDQSPSEGDHYQDSNDHEGSRGHTPQRPRQAEGRDQHTVNDGRPTIDELLLLKYTDKGKKEKLRIINEASHKWKDIANLICGDANVTTKLEGKHRGDPNECLKQTFIDYFINKKPQGYTQDWKGLIELLDDIDLETLAENVKHALDNKI